MADQCISAELVEHISQAHDALTPVRVHGGNTRAFLGCGFDGEPLDITRHRGIVEYEPNELVITVRAGTPLYEISAVLAQHNQTFGFEPPQFRKTATIGGSLACNDSGPARPWHGSIRDAILGIRLINGRGQLLRFGGRVIKNVAGFDTSRLQAGAFGALGVITELSIRVQPRPEANATLIHELDARTSVTRMNELAGTSAPICGAAWVAGRQYIRLAGNASAVAAAARAIGGEKTDAAIWQQLSDQNSTIFNPGDDVPLWRFSVSSTSDAPLDNDVVIDWAGALRYVRSGATLESMSTIARAARGHVMRLSHNSHGSEFMQQPTAGVRRLHERLKQAFDPSGILNPGRLYGWL